MELDDILNEGADLEIDYDEVLRIQAEVERKIREKEDREDKRRQRQPPTVFNSSNLPSQHMWQFTDKPQSQRWKKLLGEQVRMLLPEELDRQWQEHIDNKNPLLIEGPTGSGKGVAARLIHQLGPRHNRPFQRIGAREFSSALMVSRLHGYQKDAHSMAHDDAPGLLREADGGTLLLEDIDINQELQQLMLTFMDDHLAKRDGPRRDERLVDVRLIATTNKNTDDEAHLRSDLRYRFHEPIRIPPLVKRSPVDVAMLVQEHLRAKGPLKAISVRFLLRVMCNPWSGNIRQLSAFCDRIVLHVARNPSQPQILDESIFQDIALPAIPADESGTPQADNLKVTLNRLLSANLRKQNADRIEEGIMETANSLMLLAHLAADPHSAEGISLHPPNVPLRWIATPDSFPSCYEPLPEFKGVAMTSGHLNLVEYLSCIVRLSRQPQQVEPTDPSNDVPLQDWLKWLAGYPLPLVPDYMAMDSSASTPPRHATSGAIASTDNNSEVKGSSSPPPPGKAGGSNIRQRNPVGRNKPLSDDKLVEILQWASDETVSHRFTESKLWKKLREEAGATAHKNLKALSQRVRRITDPALKQRAKELIKHIFKNIA